MRHGKATRQPSRLGRPVGRLAGIVLVVGLVGTTVWGGREPGKDTEAARWLTQGSTLAPSGPAAPGAGRRPGPILYSRGLTPLLPETANLSRRPDFTSSRSLRTVNGTIDLARPLPGSLNRDPGEAVGPGGGTLLVRLSTGEDRPGALGRLRAAGARTLAPFGPDTFIIHVASRSAVAALSRTAGVQRLLPFGPELIVDRRIGQLPVFTPEEAASTRIPLLAGLFPGTNADEVARDLQVFGATVRSVEATPGAIPVIRFDLDYDRILAVAESVFGLLRIEEETPVRVADEEMSATLQSGAFLNGKVSLWDAGVDGGGGGLTAPQILAITDTGLSYDALHFADTLSSAGTPGPAHSKLESYLAVGSGDLQTCDAPPNGGSTHGNIVAGIAAGSVSRFGIDLRNNPGWESAFTAFAADGTARGARVVFQDAQSSSFCAGDFDFVSPGNLFDRLNEARALGAQLHNLSFSVTGSEGTYPIESINVDKFLRANRDYLVVAAVGNQGSDFNGDGNFEFGSITAPGSAKNVVGVGASNYPNEPINPFDPVQALAPGVPNEGLNLLAVFSQGSTGRGPATFPNRVKPDVMAPGQDTFPNLHVDGAATCSSSDNDNDGATNGIECILDDDNDGTSFAAAGVSGAAALVRDYFAQGFADDGAPGGPGVGTAISGAAVKATLIASAEFMRVSPAFKFDLVQPRFDVPDLRGRFNFEQGYGRVNLSRILPLYNDPETPSGLILEDLGLSGGLLAGQDFTRTVTVLNPDEELRVAVAWMDPADLAGSGDLVNRLDLEVVDHGLNNLLGDADDVIYRGNFFTEDQGNFDGRLQLPDPNNPGIVAEDSNGNGLLDESEFSLPVQPALRDYRDVHNPNEAVMLSPDPNRDGSTADTQVFAGRQYTVRVRAVTVTSPFETIVTAGDNGVLDTAPGGDDQVEGTTLNAGADGIADSSAAGDDVQVVPAGQSAPQPFALVIGGGVVNTASVRLNAGRFLCNDLVVPTVLDPTPGLLPATVAPALTVQVMAPDGGGVLDSENAIPLSQPDAGNGRFVGQAMAVIDSVVPVNNDGILSVVDGAQVLATYADADGPVVEFRASVRCGPSLDVATISIPGVNQNYNVTGGCDAPRRRDPRGILVGFPTNPQGDLFLDRGERLSYSVAILNQELKVDLIDAVATLRAVLPDGDNASDPKRLNNTPADAGPSRKVTIFNSSRDVGLIPRGTLQAVSFDIAVDPGVAFPEQIEMVFGISARRNGLPVESTVVFVHTLDMDLESFRYSTDFPTGGTETRGYAGELLDPQNPDLTFEEFVFDDATTTAFGGGNPQWAAGASEPKAPWTFDLDNEGFTTARRFDSDVGLNLELNRNLWQWNNTGQCGFQSNDPSQVDGPGGTGGIWHTGHAEDQPGTPPGRTGYDLGCEDYDFPGDSSTPTNEQVLDVLSSPVFHRVRVNPDSNGFRYTLEFTRLAFNEQVDIADANAIAAWELDPDTTTPDPVDPLDFSNLNFWNSAVGFLTGVSQIPYPTFDPNSPHDPGTLTGVGPHGPGSVGSFRDESDPNKSPARGLDEVGGTGFGTIQIRGAGGLPLRNVEEILDGFYGGNTTFEDLFGAHENDSAVPPIRRDNFQVNFSMFVKENSNPSFLTLPSYGLGIDDVVVEWVESHPVADQVPCASVEPMTAGALGSCARVLWDRSVVYEAEDSAELTVQDLDAAFGPDGIAGTGDEQAVDTNGDGLLELSVRVFSDVDLTGETVSLVQEGFLSPLYKATVQLSSSVGLNSATDGIIFMQQNGDGTVPVVISAQYTDQDDGTGSACVDNPIKATMSTQFVGGNVLFVSAKVTDLNGDLDGLPDDNERVRLDVTVVSNMIDSADNPVILENTRITLSSTDPDVACVTDSVAFYGDLIPGVATGNPEDDAFEFVVADVNRISVNQALRGTFTLGISGSFVDITGQRRVVSSFATPQMFELKLDLDVEGSVSPAPNFLENWDSAADGGDGINTFTSEPLFPVNDAATVDGSRCQFNDPDGPNPNGGGRSISFCRPWNGSNWHVHTAGEGPAGKAFSGDGSLLMGTHEIGKDASFDSYTTAQLSAAISPVFNVGLAGGSFLSFRHIVSFADDRTFNVPSGEAAGRAVVQVALAASSGTILSSWRTIPAFQNNYANQGTGAFLNCKFDPVDDFYDTFAVITNPDPFLEHNADGVSTEDDYFDPNDPERRLGPSSTCFPQFVFAFMGDWTSSNPLNSGKAFVPGEPGALGSGIWVESIFSLDAFAGESVRVRLLFSGIELNGPSGNTWAQFFGNQLGNATRGWILDDFRVTGLVDAPAALIVDSKTPPPPSCPIDPDPSTPFNEAACNVAVANAGPDLVSPAPGFLVTLDGSASTLDSCVDGFIEYRWRLDGRVVQDWSNQFLFRDNPAFSSTYSLDIRCSVDPACTDTVRVHVSMGGNLREVSQGSDSEPLLEVTAPPARILTGPDGLADSTADPESDDVQETAVGLAGEVAVSAGPDGFLQSAPAGDDIRENWISVVNWTPVGAGLGYDVQRVDLEGIDPVPLRLDPAASPPATLPASRLCRLAQAGEDIGTFTDTLQNPAAGQILGYLVNSRRLSDQVPGNLGAGLSSSSVRRARPAPPTASCP